MKTEETEVPDSTNSIDYDVATNQWYLPGNSSAYDSLDHNALRDIRSAFENLRVAARLGWQDIVHRYRRSTLGPFWLTLSRATLIGTIAMILGPLLSHPLSEFLPFLSIGFVLWSFLTGSLNDGGNAFISAEALIKQLPLPLFTHILRSCIRNVLILGHDALIVPLVFWWYGKPLGWIALLAIPGFALIILSVLSVSLILGVMCSRYRDAPQMVHALLHVMYYVTPIMWMPEPMKSGTRTLLLSFNPFYHFIEIVRAPLLNTEPSLLNWIVTLAISLITSLIAVVLFQMKHKRIVFWL